MTSIRRSLPKNMKKLHTTLIVSFLLSAFIYFWVRVNDKNLVFTMDAQHPNIQLPNYRIHIFYEANFKNLQIDGKYNRWNYDDREVINTIASSFYPSLGLYSSRDATVIDKHMKQIREAGIGVVVVSWWPPEYDDSPPMKLLLDTAHKYELQVTIHIQNYETRNVLNLHGHLLEFFKAYGSHAAFYRIFLLDKPNQLPIIYIKDPNSMIPDEWGKLMGYTDRYSVRGTSMDAFYVGLMVEDIDRMFVANAEFDGMYTYFATVNLTYGSAMASWPHFEDSAKKDNLIFIPCVSPGYDDKTGEFKQINKATLYAERRDGSYYTKTWFRAVVSRSNFVAINSFNGWLEGTQIEPAQTKKGSDYKDYGPAGPNTYLDITKRWAYEFTKRSLYRLRTH